MLQILLGADDHTASDGAYMRAIKARKWVYLTAAVGAVLAHSLYNETATAALLKVVSLPTWLLSQVVGFGLVYLTIQYALLLEQLRSVYDLELAERFAAKLATERSSAQSAVEGAASALATLDREIGSLEARQKLLESNASSGIAFSPTERDALQTQLEAAASNRLIAHQNLRDSTARARSVDERDPASRSRFVLTERLIDLLRLVPPAVVAVIVILTLLVAQF